jgi:CRISPR-associated protein Csb2
VPNNDLDAVGGDPHRVSEIRVKKTVATSLFRHRTPVLYAWPFDDGAIHAATIAKLAERLHTLGLGRDAAYAQAETASWDEAEARLLAHGGRVVRPGGTAARGSTCPTKGSLESLKQRHRDGARRFFVEGKAILFAKRPSRGSIRSPMTVPLSACSSTSLATRRLGRWTASSS